MITFSELKGPQDVFFDICICLIACEQAPSDGGKKFGERSEWDAGEPVDIVFDGLFHPLVISLLQISQGGN